MTKKEVSLYYPNGIKDYHDIISDRHRSLWQKGAWTDDTDQMLCILDSLIDNKSVNLNDIASRFVEWKKSNGIGIGRHTLNILSIGDYTNNPLKVSELIWNISGKKSAPNGGIHIHCQSTIAGKTHTESDLINIANQYDPRIAEYIELAYQPDINLLKLDEEGKIGYTLITMAAALWAYNYSTSLFDGLLSIIEQEVMPTQTGLLQGLYWA